MGLTLLILAIVSLELDEHCQDIAFVNQLLSAKGQPVQLLKNVLQLFIRHVEG